MRRFLAVLLLAAPLLASAAVDECSVSVTVNKGFAGAVEVLITLDGVPLDVSASAGSTLTAYRVPPTNGIGGTRLWTKSLTPAGLPTNRMAFEVVAADTATPGGYYFDAAVVDGSSTRTICGKLTIVGR